MKNFVNILIVTISIVQAFESSFKDDSRSYLEYPKRISFSRTQTMPRAHRMPKRQFPFGNIPHIPVPGLPPPMLGIPQSPEMIPMPDMPPMPAYPHVSGVIGHDMPGLPSLQGMPPIIHQMPHLPNMGTYPYGLHHPVQYEFGVPQLHEIPPKPSHVPVIPRIPEMPQRPAIPIHLWRLHQKESTSTRRSLISQNHPSIWFGNENSKNTPEEQFRHTPNNFRTFHQDSSNFELDDFSLCKQCDDATSECEIVDRPNGNTLLRSRNCRDENKLLLSTNVKLIPNRSGIRRIRSRVVEIA
ncbi:translation initiation factor IF-2-like [Chrysoperla carnea]|uniref:translation initiation factor IF-2-like n=1 Tax=Chrysoperla carnea TaxID=189513 RepID=UPI001D062CD0|nr:translation initiation factor IF-2-like [Chrysoperla carnea]